MKTNKAVIDGLRKQIRLAEQERNLDQAEQLKTALEHHLVLEILRMPGTDLADLSQAKRNYAWDASLPRQLHQARTELAWTQDQLRIWKNRKNAKGIRYWQDQLQRAQRTLAELSAWLAENRPDVLQGDWKPSPLDEHMAPYDDDAPDVLH